MSMLSMARAENSPKDRVSIKKRMAEPGEVLFFEVPRCKYREII